MKLSADQVAKLAESAAGLGDQEMANLCDDWHFYEHRVRELEMALWSLRPYVTNVMMRTMIDDVLPSKPRS